MKMLFHLSDEWPEVWLPRAYAAIPWPTEIEVGEDLLCWDRVCKVLGNGDIFFHTLNGSATYEVVGERYRSVIGRLKMATYEAVA